MAQHRTEDFMAAIMPMRFLKVKRIRDDYGTSGYTVMMAILEPLFTTAAGQMN